MILLQTLLIIPKATTNNMSCIKNDVLHLYLNHCNTNAQFIITAIFILNLTLEVVLYKTQPNVKNQSKLIISAVHLYIDLPLFPFSLGFRSCFAMLGIKKKKRINMCISF